MPKKRSQATKEAWRVKPPPKPKEKKLIETRNSTTSRTEGTHTPPESKRKEPRFCGGEPAKGTRTRTLYAPKKPRGLGGEHGTKRHEGQRPARRRKLPPRRKEENTDSGGLSKKHFFWFCVPMCRNVARGDTQPRGFVPPTSLPMKSSYLAAKGGKPEKGG